MKVKILGEVRFFASGPRSISEIQRRIDTSVFPRLGVKSMQQRANFTTRGSNRQQWVMLSTQFVYSISHSWPTLEYLSHELCQRGRSWWAHLFRWASQFKPKNCFISQSPTFTQETIRCHATAKFSSKNGRISGSCHIIDSMTNDFFYDYYMEVWMGINSSLHACHAGQVTTISLFQASKEPSFLFRFVSHRTIENA